MAELELVAGLAQQSSVFELGCVIGWGRLARSNARSTNRPDCGDGDPRAHIHPEPAARPLRTRSRSPQRASTRRGSIRRTQRSDLTGTPTPDRCDALRSVKTVPSSLRGILVEIVDGHEFTWQRIVRSREFHDPEAVVGSMVRQARSRTLL